jgi:serine/threonine protein kinase/dienelactone hydrolase
MPEPPSDADRPISLQPGTSFGQYRIESLLGAGGMGQVYLARDTRLHRSVAIKVAKGRFTDRFKQEARAASALNHPNIVQIFALDSEGETDFIAMEFVPGRTLAEVLASGPLPVETALDYAGQIAAAIAAAHAAGVVHRDIKPANIVVADSGRLKILDFGLAKQAHVAAAADSTITAASLTNTGTIVGTAAYMSPEQAEGKPVDARSDIFSAGVVFYEMLAGRRPFDGDSTLAVLTNLLRETPPPLRSLRPGTPDPVANIVQRCLEKAPSARYASGGELSAVLQLCRPAAPAPSSRRFMLVVAAALVAAIGLSAWLYIRYSRGRWVRQEAIPKIRELQSKNEAVQTFELVREALRWSPDDPELNEYWSKVAIPSTLKSTPPGATVYYKEYGQPAAPWREVGQTPLANVRIPGGHLQLRIVKQGFDAVEVPTVGVLTSGQNVRLVKSGSAPPQSVPVWEDLNWYLSTLPFPLPDYFIDRFEVTNSQFQHFIAAGGYRNQSFWKSSFTRDDRDLSFNDAMSQLHDKTGRPGPSTWELGAFPKDQQDHPVAGVSWYEAAAYCQSIGKSLPTVYHWKKAAGQSIFVDILRFSNFNGRGSERVGSSTGISAFGASDMAGNVKEWCANSSGTRRAILGGGWNEPAYMFTDEDAQDPFTRGPSYGFRCAVYPTPPPESAFGPMQSSVRDYSAEQPVRDDVFEIFRGMYAYDRAPLDARTERVDDSGEYWRKEKVSFRAGYGDERVPAYLFLPRNAKPPYQAVVWGPGGYAAFLNSSENGMREEYFSVLLRTGRAVLYPIYKGSYERRTGNTGGNARREERIQFVKDAFRSVDYLESRPDIQRDRLAYYGLSWGADAGVRILALEPRFKTGMLVGGGFGHDHPVPELDLINFAPRIHAPVLLLNGRFDFVYPLNTSQLPLFRLLGSPPADKRHALFDTGHAVPPFDVAREVLDWLDRYLGPVPLQ